jgi:hypothetical protein
MLWQPEIGRELSRQRRERLAKDVARVRRRGGELRPSAGWRVSLGLTLIAAGYRLVGHGAR